MKNRTVLCLSILLLAAFSSVSLAMKTVTVKLSADSAAKGYEATRAMDGNPGTMWHSIWGGGQTKLPHELVVDLGASYSVTGIVHLARPGNGNGTIKDYELFVSDNAKQPGRPVAKGTFANKEAKEQIVFPAAKGRYVTLRALAEIRGHSIYASVAELEILSPNAKFKGPVVSKAPRKPAATQGDSAPIAEPADEAEVAYNVLTDDIRRIGAVNLYKEQTFHPSSLILETDRDALDIILRRTRALLKDITGMPNAPRMVERERTLTALTKKASSVDPQDAGQRLSLFKEAFDLRRDIAFSNPLLNFDKILFIKRHRSRFNHMCDQYYGEHAVPGGGVCVLSEPFSQNPQCVDIIKDKVVQRGRLKGSKLDTGSVLSPELSYDAKSVMFAYVESAGDTGHITHLDHEANGHWHRGRCYHLFSADISPDTLVRDGAANLQQLTDGTFNDFDPCYLPNGRVAFISERRGGYLRCGRACPSYTIHDMKPDGSDLRVLSPHENNEWHPSVLNDGMLVYTRWDYVDRHGCTAHHPWIVTPDGRDSRAVHGNFSIKAERADMEMDLRAIPGSHKIIGTGTPHHGQAYGSIVVIDPRIADDDAMAPVKRVTPEVGFPESQGGKQVYGTPWPLSDKYYLVVYDAGMRSKDGRQGRQHARGNYGIYLLDAFGNKELIYRDPEIACLSPQPLRPRPTPPVVPEKCERLADSPPETGTMVVMNVYDSLKAWPEGAKIKALRLYQIFPCATPSGGASPHETGRRVAEASDSVNLARAVLGTVPVEEDGSAHFVVPALKEVYFQALDENGLAVQSMRSATWVQPGERLVCMGCHEPKSRAPVQPKSLAIALRRPPSVPTPDVDGTNPFSYARLVQPVLDKRCASCHAKNADKGAPPLGREIVGSKLGRGKTNVFQSYDSLIHKYAFWSYGDRYRTTPGKFGARASKLYEHLSKDHHGVKLSPEELHRITVWLDSVSNFYGVYSKAGGEAQLRGEIVYPTLQ